MQRCPRGAVRVGTLHAPTAPPITTPPPIGQLAGLVRTAGSSQPFSKQCDAAETSRDVASQPCSSQEGGHVVRQRSPAVVQHLNARITCQLKACTHWEQAFSIFVKYSDVFNSINTSALIHHTAQLLEARSKSGRVVGDAERQDLRAALQELHDFAEAELPRLGPRELANTVYGLSKLGILSRRFAQLMLARATPHQLNNQELANVLWALAHAGRMPGDSGWVHAVLQQLCGRLGSLKHQELANSMWALARLQISPGPAMQDALVREVRSRAAYLHPHDLSSILWSLAVWRYQPPDMRQLAPLYVSCADQACSMSPRDATTIMWSVAAGGWQLPTSWMSFMCQALSAHLPSQLAHSGDNDDDGSEQHDGEHASSSSSSSSRSAQDGNEAIMESSSHNNTGTQQAEATQLPVGSSQLPPSFSSVADDEWLSSEWEAPPCDVSQHGRYSVSSHDAALGLHALAKLQYKPQPHVLEGLLQVVMEQAWWSPPQDLIITLWSLTRLRYQVHAAHLQSALASSTVRILQYTPAQVACLVGSVARQRPAGALPPTWLRATCMHMLRRTALWGPQELSHTLWGLARLKHHLSGRVLRVLLFTLLHPGAHVAPQAVGRHAPPPAATAVSKPGNGDTNPPAPQPGMHNIGGTSISQAALIQQVQAVSHSGNPIDSTAALASMSRATCAEDGPGMQQASWADLRRQLQVDPAYTPPPELRHQHLANTLWAITRLLPEGQQQQFGYLNHDLLRQVEQASLQLLRGSHVGPLTHPKGQQKPAGHLSARSQAGQAAAAAGGAAGTDTQQGQRCALAVTYPLLGAAVWPAATPQPAVQPQPLQQQQQQQEEHQVVGADVTVPAGASAATYGDGQPTSRRAAQTAGAGAAAVRVSMGLEGTGTQHLPDVLMHGPGSDTGRAASLELPAAMQQAGPGWAACELLPMIHSFAVLCHHPSRAWMSAHCRQVARSWHALTHMQRKQVLRSYAACGGNEAVRALRQELRTQQLAGQAAQHKHFQA